jgi:hypothetical protein
MGEVCSILVLNRFDAVSSSDLMRERTTGEEVGMIFARGRGGGGGSEVEEGRQLEAEW